MTNKEILKELFQLPKDDILDVLEIINGYKERVNKSKKDTLLMRCLFIKGYHNSRKFYKENKIAAYLQIPYVLWLLYAGYLNFAIYLLNS